MFDNLVFPLVLVIRKLNFQQLTNRTLLKMDVKARYPTFISTTMIEVNTKSSGKSANLRHMILFRTYLTNSFFSMFFFLIEEMMVYNVKMSKWKGCYNILKKTPTTNKQNEVSLTTSINNFFYKCPYDCI